MLVYDTLYIRTPTFNLKIFGYSKIICPQVLYMLILFSKVQKNAWSEYK